MLERTIYYEFPITPSTHHTTPTARMATLRCGLWFGG